MPLVHHFPIPLTTNPSYIESEIEREVEVAPMRKDDELVAEVAREQAIERGRSRRMMMMMNAMGKKSQR